MENANSTPSISMEKKHTNKWVALGTRLFAYFALLIIVSLVMVDMPGSPPQWMQQLVYFLQIVYFLLPISGILACGYGLYSMDPSKESGKAQAIAIITLLLMFVGLYLLMYFSK